MHSSRSYWSEVESAHPIYSKQEIESVCISPKSKFDSRRVKQPNRNIFADNNSAVTARAEWNAGIAPVVFSKQIYLNNDSVEHPVHMKCSDEEIMHLPGKKIFKAASERMNNRSNPLLREYKLNKSEEQLQSISPDSPWTRNKPVSSTRNVPGKYDRKMLGTRFESGVFCPTVEDDFSHAGNISMINGSKTSGGKGCGYHYKGLKHPNPDDGTLIVHEVSGDAPSWFGSRRNTEKKKLGNNAKASTIVSEDGPDWFHPKGVPVKKEEKARQSRHRNLIDTKVDYNPLTMEKWKGVSTFDDDARMRDKQLIEARRSREPEEIIDILRDKLMANCGSNSKSVYLHKMFRSVLRIFRR